MSFKRLLPVLATAALACSSDTPSPSEPEGADRPVVLQFYGPPGNVSPGDTITFNFVLRDSTLGKKFLTLRFDGALSRVFSFELEMSQFVWSGFVWVKLPAEAEPLKTTVATLIFTNDAGLSHHKTFSIPIWDIRHPEVVMALGGLRGDGTIGTGQLLDLQIIASDNHRLTHIGYSGGGLRDSVPASSIGDSHVFRIAVPAWWTEPRPIVTAFARDASGNVSVAGVGIPVFDWSDHPMVTVPFTEEPSITGVLWDARREVVYLLRGTQIDVVSPSGPLGTPIALSSVPHSMALTESGDSLVVTLPGEKALGIVDLLAATRSASLVPLTYQNEVGRERWPNSVIVSGSHVFVALEHGLYSAHLLDVNLDDGTQTIRTDFDLYQDGLDGDPSLFRLPDGRIYVASQARSGGDARFLYSPATDRFSRNYSIRKAVESSFSTALSGRFMVANTVYEPSLDTHRVIETHDWKEDLMFMPAAALSQDGNSVFLGTHYGIARFNLNSTFPSKQIKLDTWTRFLLATPDGNRLIAVGGRPFTVGQQAVTFIDIR